jgi:hypothetical protein
MPPTDVILQRFETPDEFRIFERGRYELVTIGGIQIGRATYDPGWRWSEHVGPELGQTHCELPHVGLVIRGHAVVEFTDGRIVDLTTGTLFEVPAEPHDSWVVGDDKYVFVHATVMIVTGGL